MMRRLKDGFLPVIARLGGIVIIMHFQEHNPPHFHVNSGGVRAVVGIDPPELREGWLSASDRHIVLAWTYAHQAELLANWDRVIRHEQPVKIDEHLG
jgi:hypothetical protein